MSAAEDGEPVRSPSVDDLRRELGRARQENADLFDSAPVGYFILDEEGRIVRLNRAATRLLQADRRYALGRSFASFVPRSEQPRFRSLQRRVFDEEQPLSNEMPLVDRRGRQLWGRIESRLRVDPEGSRRCLMAVIDVTDRKRIEDDLILAREDAVQAGRAKSAFLANMSHEIRTPLNAVVAMSELLLDTPLNAEQRDWLTITHCAAGELKGIIDDVLDYSRIETGRIEIHAAPFDLFELMASVEALYSPQAAEKGVGFRVDTAEAAASRYHGDRVRIRQILCSIMGNALKFTTKGEIAMTVRSRAISEHLHELTFEVRDTGIGIKESSRDSIFESFQQADISPSKTFKGAGLGLSISRRLARLMSGQISFTSQEGRGSTFTLTLPLHPQVNGNDGMLES